MHSPSAAPISRISRLAVLGPGLLGGSVARAVLERSLADRICLWARREAAVEEIKGLDLCHEASTDLEEVAAGADFVVIATPVGAIKEVATRLLQSELAPGAVVTDVGSVKGPVVSALKSIFEHADPRFVGSHPMAGAEQDGIRASRADLFEGAACILTPDSLSGDEQALSTVASFWRNVGCRVFQMTAEEHDMAAATISHVPHVAAAALVHAALGQRRDGQRGDRSHLVGRGFLDTTRIASGSPVLWEEILLENRDSVVASLAGLRENLGRVLEMLDRGNAEALRTYLHQAKELRDGCLAGSAEENSPRNK